MGIANPGTFLPSFHVWSRSSNVSNGSLACVTRAYPSAQEGQDSPPLAVTATINNTQYQLNTSFTYSWNSTPQVSAQHRTLSGKVIGCYVMFGVIRTQHEWVVIVYLPVVIMSCQKQFCSFHCPSGPLPGSFIHPSWSHAWIHWDQLADRPRRH